MNIAMFLFPVFNLNNATSAAVVAMNVTAIQSAFQEPVISIVVTGIPISGGFEPTKADYYELSAGLKEETIGLRRRL